jgi:hypothetical protein
VHRTAPETYIKALDVVDGGIIKVPMTSLTPRDI